MRKKLGGLGAHRAGLQGHDQVAVGQPRRPERAPPPRAAPAARHGRRRRAAPPPRCRRAPAPRRPARAPRRRPAPRRARRRPAPPRARLPSATWALLARAWRRGLADAAWRTTRPIRPLIGVTLDAEQPGGYSKYPWYALRANYADALAAAGGLPSRCRTTPALADAYLDAIDGLVVTGGAFDVDPGALRRRRPARDRQPQGGPHRRRTRAGARRARRGTCRCSASAAAQQLLAVALGGTLIQHIPDERRRRARARAAQPAPRAGARRRHRAGHAAPRDHRARRRMRGELRPSSGGARAPGRSPWSNATAPDGVIEGIEDRALPLLPRRAVAPRVPDRPRRPPHLRGVHRSLPAHDESAASRRGARGERIAKWLARAGVASRRDAERLIAEGRVRLERRASSTIPATFVAPGDIVQVRRPRGRRAGADAAVALSQAGRAGDDAPRPGGPADRVRARCRRNCRAWSASAGSTSTARACCC